MTSSEFMEKSSSAITSIKSLPKDMVAEVVARVASHSFIDLHNMKRSCKDFLEAAEDNCFFQRVSLDNFPLFPHKKKDLTFYKRCKENENRDCLYREGFLEYFVYLKGDIDGLESLKMAAKKGHKDAKYLYGMILLCSQDEDLRKQGLDHMRVLRNSKCVMACRNEVKQLKNRMWKINRILVRNPNLVCQLNTCKGWRLKKGRWILFDDDDDDDMGLCEYCRWDYELDFFYDLFNVH